MVKEGMYDPCSTYSPAEKSPHPLEAFFDTIYANYS